jgi:hypothetical protein
MKKKSGKMKKTKMMMNTMRIEPQSIDSIVQTIH